MPNAGDPPSPETPFDRFLRFGTALFAVRKDELPKRRGSPAKPKREPDAKKAS